MTLGLALWGVVLTSSCNSPKTEARTADGAAPNQAGQPEGAGHFDRAQQLSDAFASRATERGVEVSIKERDIAADGSLVLTLNGRAPFADGAILTIGASAFDDFNTVVDRMKVVMEVSSGRGQIIKSMDLTGNDKVPVGYGN